MSVSGESVEEDELVSKASLCGKNKEEGTAYYQAQRPLSPVPSCVSMKSDHSMFEPLSFSGGSKHPCLETQRPSSSGPSLVSMRSDHSMFEPLSFSDGLKHSSLETERPSFPVSSCVSMRSDHYMFKPPSFNGGVKHPGLETERPSFPVSSCVSMRSDHYMFKPPSFNGGVKHPGLKTQRPSSSGPSLVSMKSDHYMFEPPSFSGGSKHPSLETQRPSSSGPSLVYMRSDHSMFGPPSFSEGPKCPWLETQEPSSSVSSCVSMRSDHSMFEPPSFSDGLKQSSLETQRPVSPIFSSVSMKSDHSMFEPLSFSDGLKRPWLETQRPSSSGPSLVSMRSDGSMLEPPFFSDEPKRPRLETQRPSSSEPSLVSMRSDRSMFEPPFSFSGGPKHPGYQVYDQFLKVPASSSCGHSLCTQQCISRFCEQHDSLGRSTCQNITKSQNISLSLKNKESMQLEQPAEDVLQKVLLNHKKNMKNKYECLFEGMPMEKNRTLLNNIYTQLYIIEGENEGVNEEHEVLQIQKSFRGDSQGIPISYSDLFKPLPEQETDREPYQETETLKQRKFKTVLTKGIAGIGKTVSVQKFILDWAEGKANQDVDFMFVLPFRELNLVKEEQSSLHKLLCDFYPELKDLDPKMYDVCKTMFIFDGLDESRIPLNSTTSSKKISDVTMKLSVSELMMNLIKGELLPSAQIWITSRPAAASQIPSQYVSRVTEIQGFSDPQKEEYFKKRIKDPHQANRVFSQIIKAKTLYIMCHIPIFCWISATVIQQILAQDAHDNIPTTLTEMYIHFMLIQTKTKNLKYHLFNPVIQTTEIILKLAKLAFKQLIKGNILFYEEDLEECGIDVTEASVYSGICTEIFKSESVLYQKKVYCFVHLSFQEFFAAIFAFHCCVVENTEGQKMFQTRRLKEKGTFVDNFMKTAINKALESRTGHLDLFLRFLYGISEESNWKLIHHIVPPKCGISEDFQKNIRRVRQKRLKNVSPDRWINFLHCYIELKDDTFQKEIKTLLNSKKKLSQWDCTSIAFMMQMSEEVLDEFDPKNYKTSEDGFTRLIPLVRSCRKALLAHFKPTKQHCGIILSALQSPRSTLVQLDLSHNNIEDSGVKLLCAGLKNPHCKLEILRLVMCNLTNQTCEFLAPALQSANLPLKELDLSQNDLQDSGVKMLSGGLRSPNCQLEILRLSGCLVTEEGVVSLASALSLNPSHLRELDLSYNHPGDSVKLLSDKLDDPNFKLDKLNMSCGGVFRIKPGVRKYACELSLDLNTLSKQLVVSEENRKVTHMRENQESYPDHPERFDCPQVLCREPMSERRYWEVEWSSRADIAVAYKGIKRKGSAFNYTFGSDEMSWSLTCYTDSHTFYVHHNNNPTLISAPGSHSNRVGVYLDWPAGTLSFYSVLSDGNTLTHLHTVQCRFTEPLYAGFRVYESVSLCHI